MAYPECSEVNTFSLTSFFVWKVQNRLRTLAQSYQGLLADGHMEVLPGNRPDQIYAAMMANLPPSINIPPPSSVGKYVVAVWAGNSNLKIIFCLQLLITAIGNITTSSCSLPASCNISRCWSQLLINAIICCGCNIKSLRTYAPLSTWWVFQRILLRLKSICFCCVVISWCFSPANEELWRRSETFLLCFSWLRTAGSCLGWLVAILRSSGASRRLPQRPYRPPLTTKCLQETGPTTIGTISEGKVSLRLPDFVSCGKFWTASPH